MQRTIKYKAEAPQRSIFLFTAVFLGLCSIGHAQVPQKHIVQTIGPSQGTLVVTAKVTSSVAILVKPDGTQAFVVANAPDLVAVPWSSLSGKTNRVNEPLKNDAKKIGVAPKQQFRP